MSTRALPPLIGPRFVACHRVETDRQGGSGLGPGAQREAVTRHAAGTGGVVQAASEEVESGRRSDRPRLALAGLDRLLAAGVRSRAAGLRTRAVHRRASGFAIPARSWLRRLRHPGSGQDRCGKVLRSAPDRRKRRLK